MRIPSGKTPVNGRVGSIAFGFQGSNALLQDFKTGNPPLQTAALENANFKAMLSQLA